MSKHSKLLTLFLAIAFLLVLSGIAQQQGEETVVCPVSGKEIKKAEVEVSYEYKGKTYYFCCENCKEKFIENPEKHTQKKEEMKEVYTCPMHPEVKSDKPGECPECGMKLEKKMVPMKQMHGKEGMQEHKMHKMHEMHKSGKIEMQEHMEHKETGDKLCCPMMMFEGAEVTIENVDEGVVVKITSKDAVVVKRIQETAAKLKTMCCVMEDCCKKEEEKKEEK